MAYRCSFLDNEVYSASDVNNVFACLTSGGVTFVDTGNTLSDLNDAVGMSVSAGVMADGTSCKVVKDDAGYKISAGACFMNDGSVIIFDEDGERITPYEGTYNYVYIERNSATNSIDIVVSQMEGRENSIPLAEIDEDGDVFDKRKYALSRVMLGVGNTLKNFDVEFNEWEEDKTETLTIDIGSGDFSYIVIWGGTYTGTDGKTETRVSSGKNLSALADGTKTRLLIGRGEYLPLESVYAKKNGQYLEIFLSDVINNSKYTLSFAVI